jgi:ABC-type phosphate transport system ATPase subunit
LPRRAVVQPLDLPAVVFPRIEETLQGLCTKYRIVIVTHNLQQAARISSTTDVTLRSD